MNIWDLPHKEFLRAAKMIKAQNKEIGQEMECIPSNEWGPGPTVETMAKMEPGNSKLIEVWRSRDFLCQIYDLVDVERLSINRCIVDIANRRWRDGITWDELQWVKKAVGRGDRDAVEFFPRENDQVNVANIRHVWVWKGECPLSFIWRKKQ